MFSESSPQPKVLSESELVKEKDAFTVVSVRFG
jgi:hypothetical protein